MQARTATLASTTLALAGCGAEILDVWLPLPEPEGAQTMLVGVPERSSARVYVGPAEDLERFDLALESRGPDDGPIEVAFFERAADSGLVTPGWQTPATGRPGRPLALGDDALLGSPTRSFRADLFDAPARWTPTEGLSNLVAGFEVGVDPPTCPTLHSPDVTLKVDLELAWASALSDTLVLVADTAGGLRIFSSADGALTEVDPAHSYVRADYHDGWAYLADSEGQVWRGQADPVTVLDVARPLGDPLPRRVVALAAGGPEDVFALVAGGEVLHFDGQAWSSVGRGMNVRSRMRWVGPQRALLFADAPNVVYVATPEGLAQETIEGTGILSGTWTPEFGVVVGTSDGELIQEVEGGWRKLGDARAGWWVVDVAPFGQGVAKLLASGTVSGHQVGIGDCGDQYVLHIITVGTLIPQAGGLLIVAKKADLPTTDFALLEPL